jgi:hypothetical protein
VSKNSKTKIKQQQIQKERKKERKRERERERERGREGGREEERTLPKQIKGNLSKKEVVLLPPPPPPHLQFLPSGFCFTSCSPPPK